MATSTRMMSSLGKWRQTSTVLHGGRPRPLDKATFQQRFNTHFTTVLPHRECSPLNVNLTMEAGPHILGAHLNYRFLHTSSVDMATPDSEKPSSKVEETVRRLQEKDKDKKKLTPLKSAMKMSMDVNKITRDVQRTVMDNVDEISKNTFRQTLRDISETQDLEKKVKSVIESYDESKAKEMAVEKSGPKKPLWTRFVNEVKHYYSGFKLLFLDVKISSKILWKVAQGKQLSRRENRQLVRTVSDLFRLVPFSVFIIVPFMEFLLPVALKLFPGMLPSTFTTSSDREDKLRRALRAKLEYAKFLQRTLDEMGPSSGTGRSSQSAKDFVNFYNRVRSSGEPITNREIIQYSKLFEDEITLDHMTRPQLVALCRLLDLTPVGTTNFLKFEIEVKLRNLKADDKLIQKEGLENMQVSELQSACKERGMRAFGLTQEALRRQLGQWLDLSLNHKVPSSLLLLSRTLYLPDTLDAPAQIAATISSLPEAAAKQTSATIGEREGKIHNVTRLEVLREEQRKIEEEEAESKAHKDKDDAAKLAEKEAEKQVTEAGRVVKKATVTPGGDVKEELLIDRAPVLTDIEPLTEVIQESSKSTEKQGTRSFYSTDLEHLKTAIENIERKRGKEYNKEREELLKIAKELEDYEEDLTDLEKVKNIVQRHDLKETKGAKRLFHRVNKMLLKVDNLEGTLREREKEIERTIEALRGSMDALDHNHEIREEDENLVTMQELINAVHQLQKTPEESKLDLIAEVLVLMDVDSDGVIKMDHVRKVIELLGREKVQISGRHINQIIDMLEKEEMLDVERNIERILDRSDTDPHSDDHSAEDIEESEHAATISRLEEKTMEAQDIEQLEDLREEVDKAVSLTENEVKYELKDTAKDLSEKADKEVLEEKEGEKVQNKNGAK